MQPKFLILLVDDDPLLVDILTRAAQGSFPEAFFIQVFSSSEAITYIQALDGRGPKLVLLDIDLGAKLNGFDFLAFLRTHDQARFLPVVMLTVDDLPSTIGSAYLMGASSFTVKPASFEGWKTYFATLRLYWFSTVTIPPIRFQKWDYWKPVESGVE
ncbi:response regulator [Spirosoma endophyticum]|uniref:Response regulator receiver domain-containing protein n=1 Tax=Spirosoma endophyticum TaxID=662367 RepID=A0A1I2GVL3_9BACT|nr:response regulator [Spirosoma endophyticum]SFF21725.1 Response regulator receiver domain-containing protein [Spirosoma endophyticum]